MNILIISISAIFIFLFIVLLLKNYQLAKYFRLLDKPELEKHKIHKEVIPATGGVYIFLLLCVYTILNYQNINILFSFLLLGNFIIEASLFYASYCPRTKTFCPWTKRFWPGQKICLRQKV